MQYDEYCEVICLPICGLLVLQGKGIPPDELLYFGSLSNLNFVWLTSIYGNYLLSFGQNAAN